MKTSVTKIFTFEMAHQLTSCYSGECKNTHGHSYKLEVQFEGDLNEDGMIMDFKKMKEYVQPIVDEYDHSFLTEESFGKNPTAENMVYDIFSRIRFKTFLVKKVRLWETATCYAEIAY